MSDVTPDVPGAAKARIGKFPVWLVALVIVGGGALLLFVLRRSGAGTVATTATGTLDATGYSTSGIPSGGSTTTASDASSGAVDTTASSPASATTSNATWLAKATAGLRGVPVTRKQDLQQGDLLFPTGVGTALGDHVQIYSGNGNIIEAPKPGTPVRERTMWGFSGDKVTARRLVKKA